MASCIPLIVMRSLTIPAALLLTILFPLVCTSKLKDLLLYKYRNYLFPDVDTGPSTGPIREPLTFKRDDLTSADHLRLLDNFEQDPQAVFIDFYIHPYAFELAVIDFACNVTSKEIIFYYKEIELADKYVEALIYHAFRFNSPEVIEVFMEFIERYYNVGVQGKYKDSTWMTGAVEGASFNILESLITNGIYIVPPSEMVFEICTRFNAGILGTKSSTIEKALDFLNLLNNLLTDAVTKPGTVPIFHPISFIRDDLTNADNLQLLDNFEENPQAVFNDQYMSAYAFNLAVRDYAHDDTSKEIISYYKEIGLADKYVEALIYNAFHYNVPEVIELFMDFIELYNAAGRQGQYQGKSWMNGAMEGASFNILASLIDKKIYIVPPSEMVFAICTRFNAGILGTKSSTIEKALDFLNLLIHIRGDIDVNERLHSDNVVIELLHLNDLPPLITCLKIESNNRANQQKIVNLLMELGADPYMTDKEGISGIELAMERNIELAASK